MTPLDLAILFHETYERLAPEFGYWTRKSTRKFRPDTRNGKLMIAVCNEIQQNMCSDTGTEREYRERYAARLMLRGYTHDDAWASAKAAEFDPADLDPEGHADDEVSYATDDGGDGIGFAEVHGW